MNCQHCKQPLTPIATFGDPGECFCQECQFELIDLRVEMRDARTELSQAKAAVAAFEHTADTSSHEMREHWRTERAIPDLETNITMLQGAIEKFNRYAKETP